MQGAFEFVVTGTLKTYDAHADLPRSRSPYSHDRRVRWSRPEAVKGTPSSFLARDSSSTRRRPCHLLGCARREREGRTGIPAEHGQTIIRFSRPSQRLLLTVRGGRAPDDELT